MHYDWTVHEFHTFLTSSCKIIFPIKLRFFFHVLCFLGILAYMCCLSVSGQACWVFGLVWILLWRIWPQSRLLREGTHAHVWLEETFREVWGHRRPFESPLPLADIQTTTRDADNTMGGPHTFLCVCDFAGLFAVYACSSFYPPLLIWNVLLSNLSTSNSQAMSRFCFSFLL